MSTDFITTSSIAKADETLGLVFGYAMVSKIDGKPHFDLHGHHIPDETIVKSLFKFASKPVAKEMHSGEAIGEFVFLFPLTEDIAKSLDIQAKQYGALVAMKPYSNDIVQKFVSGEYTGFSIGGTAKMRKAPDEFNDY